MKTKTAAPRTVSAKPERVATIEAYLSEHGGVQMLKTVGDDGATVTGAQFPDPLPTLAAAMRDYPCKDDHKDATGADRYPAICCTARRLKKGATFTDDGLDGPDCGRQIKIQLLGRKQPHVGCPSCRPFPPGYDITAEREKQQEVQMLEQRIVIGPRRQRRAAARTLKKVAKKRPN